MSKKRRGYIDFFKKKNLTKVEVYDIGRIKAKLELGNGEVVEIIQEGKIATEDGVESDTWTGAFVRTAKEIYDQIIDKKLHFTGKNGERYLSTQVVQVIDFKEESLKKAVRKTLKKNPLSNTNMVSYEIGILDDKEDFIQQ